jgi:tRNA-dihydrouridine synthase
MRIKTTLEETIEFAQMLERNGASVIAVHGRTRDQKVRLATEPAI